MLCGELMILVATVGCINHDKHLLVALPLRRLLVFLLVLAIFLLAFRAPSHTPIIILRPQDAPACAVLCCSIADSVYRVGIRLC
jgi:hypothetical protein